MEESWITLSPDERADLDRFLSGPGWQVVSQSVLPVVFPGPLRDKVDSALVVNEPTSTGGRYLVVSALRPDPSDDAIDIEPFGLIVHSTGASSSGVFLHHGEWEGRSQSAPPDFWQGVQQHGVGDYFLTKPPSGLMTGSLAESPLEHRGAFDAVVGALRNRADQS